MQTYILVLGLSLTHPTPVGKSLALSASLKEPGSLGNLPSTLIHTSDHRPPKQTPTLTSFQLNKLSPHSGDLQTNQVGGYQRPCKNKQRETDRVPGLGPLCYNRGGRHNQV